MTETDLDALTADDLTMVGMSYGLDGVTETYMLDDFCAQCGKLLPWQIESLLTGREIGLADFEAFRSDRSNAPASDDYTPDPAIPY